MAFAVDGQKYEDRFEYLTKDFQPENDLSRVALGDPSKEGGNVTYSIEHGATGHKTPLGSDIKEPLQIQRNLWEHLNLPTRIHGGSSLNIDRDHHVPLAASGTLDERGNMTGLAVNHLAPDPPDPMYFQHVALHEATEIPFMHNRIAEGATPQEAYHEGHDVATRIESNAVRGYAARAGLDPDKYLDDYKQYWRDVASVASQPSDRPRHPNAHTTVHGLDEAELQYPNLGHGDEPPKPGEFKKPLPIIPDDEPMPKRPDKPGTKGVYSENVINFPGQTKIDHPPMQIDVLGQGVAMHSGPGPFVKPGKKYKGFANDDQIETAADKMLDLYHENPNLYKYYRAMYEQKGGEEWEDWKKIEKIINFIKGNPAPKHKFETIEGGKE